MSETSMNEATERASNALITACTALEDFSELTGLPMRVILAAMYNDCYNKVGKEAGLCPAMIGFDAFVCAWLPLPDEI